jgi:hypothetical protein
MMKEKRLYLILLLLLIFALSGEHLKWKQDLHRAATGLMHLLQVDELIASGPLPKNRGIQNLADKMFR